MRTPAPGAAAPAIPQQRRPPDQALGLPPARAWLAAVALRNVRGMVAGILGGWFNVPFVLLMAVVGAVIGAVAGAFNGTFAGTGVLARLNKFLEFVFPLPVKAEDLLPTAAAQIGGIIGGIIGAVYGAGRLAWMAAVWPWELLYAADPMWPWMLGVGQVVTALFCGALYVLFMAATEQWRLRISGARRLSRREADWLEPILARVATDMGLARVPRLLIDDRREVNAVMHLRHLVLYRGLLDEVDHDRRAVAGVIAHELGHWRNGDVIALLWTKGIALPIYLLYVMAVKLLSVARFRPLQVVLRMMLWAFTTTVERFVIPLQAADWRAAEYRADAEAAAAGHGPGLRMLLEGLYGTFESGRDGWDQAVCATHPPIELRLERLERQGRRYPLNGMDYGLGADVIGSAPASTVGRSR